MKTAKHGVVLGLGVSGVAAAQRLHEEGALVDVYESSASPSHEERAVGLRRLGIGVTLGVDFPPAPGAGVDLCVVSPGVPVDGAWCEIYREAGTPMCSELELGVERCACPWIAVTGTNGKSTLVKLCMDILRRAGMRAEMAGNCGVPVSRIAAGTQALDWLVVEVSSFQLELSMNLRPDVAVLLNVQPDHLDRHGTVEAYRDLKMRLFRNQAEGDTAVVPWELRHLLNAVSPEVRRYAFGTDAGADWRLRDHAIMCGQGDAVELTGSLFDNDILGLAAAAATGVAHACRVGGRVVSDAIADFDPLPHRLQTVAELNGVRYVDDSKATNLAAVAAGLRVMGGGVRLVAGGRLKEGELGEMKEVLAKHVVATYLIGEAASDMYESWRDVVPCEKCGTLRKAVEMAREQAVPGETVLLSPGCASFDQFRDYRQRGEEFARHVEQLMAAQVALEEE